MVHIEANPKIFTQKHDLVQKSAGDAYDTVHNILESDW